MDPNDFLGVLHRQPFNQYGIDQSKHGTVRTDAQRQRDDADQRETRILNEHPDAEFYVLKDSHRMRPDY